MKGNLKNVFSRTETKLFWFHILVFGFALLWSLSNIFGHMLVNWVSFPLDPWHFEVRVSCFVENVKCPIFYLILFAPFWILLQLSRSFGLFNFFRFPRSSWRFWWFFVILFIIRFKKAVVCWFWRKDTLSFKRRINLCFL